MMASGVEGRKVLVTGGTGSFGHTVARELLGRGAAEVRILSRDEAKQDAMRHDLRDSRARFYLGDVRDQSSVERAVSGVNFVFHAAALKQVPSSEFFPLEAVKTNVIGSDNVIRMAEAAGVESVVCLSTDKAVYPVNAMGMTKGLMEKIAQSHGLGNPHAATTVSCVRYGNVMYSRGSVIPLFLTQMRAGRHLTVTDPQMTRFMMTLAESVDLVDFAFTNAEQGDLFIRKSPACTIGDLATAMIELFQSSARVDIIGTRHAEKKSETLATREELARADDRGDYFRVRADKRDLNYNVYFEEGDVAQQNFEDYDSHTVERLHLEGVKKLLLRLPEIQRELDREGIDHTPAAD